MDKLGVFVKTLAHAERQSFRNFLKTKSRGKGNQRISLFDLMIREKDAADIKKALYKKEQNSDNAYYQLRKLLVCELEQFLLSHKNEIDHKTEVYRKIDIAQHFIDRLQYEMSWNYLKEAEDIALANGFFEILYTIYMLQFQLCNCEPAYRAHIPEILEKKRKNLRLLNEMLEIITLDRSDLLDTTHLDDLLWKICQGAIYQNADPVIFRKISWLMRIDQLPHAVIEDFKDIITRMISRNNDQEFSLQNQMLLYILQIFLCVRTKEFIVANQYMLELERLIKTQKQTPLNIILDACFLKAEILLYTGHLNEALEKTEKNWLRYKDIIPADYKIILLSTLINLCVLQGKEEKAIYYFEFFEMNREAYISLYGQHNYYKVLLLKAALLYDLNEEAGMFRTICQIEKNIFCSYSAKALRILKDCMNSDKRKSSGLCELQTALVTFTDEYPVNEFVLHIPDFNIWAKAGSEQASYLETVLNLPQATAALPLQSSSFAPVLI